jgi:cysteine desulfurase
MKKIVYVDNNATTRVDPIVFNAMKPYFNDIYFNPSSAYKYALLSKDAITNARKKIADILYCDKDEIIFTGSATESNNTAIFSALNSNKLKRHIITTKVEHPATLETCKYYEENGYEVTYLSVDNKGELDIDEFKKALKKETCLVTIMHANNETGVMFPIEKLSNITKEFDQSIIFHTDATQTVGKIEIDLSYSFKNVDMLSFSGHKLHAPKGIGVLFVRENIKFQPFIIGGHQENSKRAGTENVAYIVGIAKALELAKTKFCEEKEIENLRDKLENYLLENIPNIRINGKGAKRLFNTTNVSFEFIEGESILYQLEAKNICCSTGSACSSGSLDPSHVLTAMHIPKYAAYGSIRFSFSRFNNEKDVDYIIKHIPKIIKNLRRISPFWDSKNNCPRAI